MYANQDDMKHFTPIPCMDSREFALCPPEPRECEGGGVVHSRFHPHLGIASHIIRGQDRKDTRLEPRNGLCLTASYDNSHKKQPSF